MILIEMKDIHKGFLKGSYRVDVLTGLSMTVEPGELIAIVGPSGAGKSTLMHIIGGLDRPESGTVSYMGEDIFGRGKRALDEYRNRTVGFVFQFHYLLDDFTAKENVMMPGLIAGDNREEAARRADMLLARVGLSDRAGHVPVELSGGEQQRTAIARALFNKPKILLADEPTGNLDRKNSMEILDIITALADEGVAVMIVTHDEAIAERCHRTVRLEKA